MTPVPLAGIRSGPRAQRPLRASGAALAVGSVLSYLVFVLLSVRTHSSEPDLLEIGYIFAFLLFALVGCLIVWHRSHNPLGWLMTLGGLAVVLSAALDAYAYAVLVSGDLHGPSAVWARWTESWLYAGGWGVVTAFPLLLLPGGHLPASGWRWVGVLAGTLVALSVLVTALIPGPIGDDVPVQNPVGLEGSGQLLAWLNGIVMWALFGVTILGLISLVVRWRRAWGAERRRLAWPLLGVLVSLALMAVSFGAAGAGASEAVAGALVAASLGAFPLSIAGAVLREGLLDIELVLRRTLIYTVLSAVIVGSYVLALTLASRWFATSADVAVSILATVLVVLALGSLKTRLEQWVSRALFGRGDRPQAVLAALAACGERHLDGATLLRELESQLCAAMRLPYVAIRRDVCGRAATPSRPGTEVFPLVHAGIELGCLEVSQRSPNEPLTTEETRLLEAAALQIAGLVRSAGLDTELRAARASLVRSREQERLRIRRDLHDGLGPVLAATTLQVDALRRRLDRHDVDGQAIADRVSNQLQSAVTDVRGLIEGLRPPALDQMGLGSSIGELVAPLRDAGLVVELDLRVPESLDPATEVAAYRIAAEALTNVLRHSAATRCRVSARTDSSALLLAVLDNGSGFSRSGHAGVGLASMAERAAELGGTLTLSPAEPRGTQLAAVLPLGEP